MKNIFAFLFLLAALLFAPSLSVPALAQATAACAPSAGVQPGDMLVGGVDSSHCYWLLVNSDGSINTNVSSGGASGITPTDRTITSATGASQTVMAANASRKGLTIQNTGNANCGVNPTGGTAVIGGAGTITLLPAGSYTPRIATLSAITAICTAAQPLYASEQ